MVDKLKKKVAKKTSGKLGKLWGAANLVLGVIPDTVEIVGHITDKAAPIVEKELDRQHEYKRSLIDLPNLKDVPIQDAQDILEEKGLSVIRIKAKPDKQFSDAEPDEVVAMVPKQGKVRPGSHVKLYFVDEAIIAQSKQMKWSLDVRGLPVKEASQHLEEMGYLVHIFPVKAHKKYAETPEGQVVKMSPSPSSLQKQKLVKLYVVDEMVLEESQWLKQQEQETLKKHVASVKTVVKQLQDKWPTKQEKN